MSKTTEIQVELASKTITVRKLPIGKYSELLKSLDNLPGMVDQFSDKDNDAILAELPQIITDFLPQFAILISTATWDPAAKAPQLTTDEVEGEVGLDDAIEIIKASWEVNNFSTLVEQAKKLMARKPKADPLPEPTPTQTNG